MLTNPNNACVCTCGSHLFRRLPGVVQRTRTLYPGAERLALHLPGWMEWAWMQRCHGNWLQWWNRQRWRWHSNIYHFPSLFSLLYLFSFLSLWAIVPSVSPPPASSFLSILPCCPNPAETPVESCWSLLYWNIFICVCVCVRVWFSLSSQLNV